MKTHKGITIPFLRHCLASELWQARKVRCAYPGDEFIAMRYGIESGIWAVQKAMMAR